MFSHYVHHIWQETWDQQVINKLHGIHPSTAHWAAVPVRRHDVRLTRLRIGHTRLTHRHLQLGESPPQKEKKPVLFHFSDKKQRGYGSERLIDAPYSLGFAASYAYEKPIVPGHSKILHDDQALTEKNFNGVDFCGYTES
ncbi:hypothetical protein TNCV_2925951 [Trichonephila clavipes]|nr:hypothetical protein TNCV_2925951 [Trichonephila clavipes]